MSTFKHVQLVKVGEDIEDKRGYRHCSGYIKFMAFDLDMKGG